MTLGGLLLVLMFVRVFLCLCVFMIATLCLGHPTFLFFDSCILGIRKQFILVDGAHVETQHCLEIVERDLFDLFVRRMELNFLNKRNIVHRCQ